MAEANVFDQFLASSPAPQQASAGQNPFDQFVTTDASAKAPQQSEMPRYSNVVAVTGEGFPVFENPEDNKQFYSSTADFMKKSLSGIPRGMRDPIDAGAQLLTRGLESGINYIAPGSSAANYMKGERQRVEDINKTAESDYTKDRGDTAGPDLGRFVGNVMATAPIAAAAPGAAAEGLLGRTAAGIVGGGASGALEPVDTEKTPDFWAEKAKQTGLGAAGGAVVPALVGGAARVVSPNVSSDVQKLMGEGITPTPGQILGGSANRIEEAATSIPLVGDVIKSARQRSVQDLNRAAINRSLEPIGEKLDPETQLGREAITEASDKISDSYNKLLPTLKVQADPPFVSDMTELAKNANYMPPERISQFKDILRSTLGNRFSPTGGMTGESFKEAESGLGKIASDYQNSGNADERQLGGALKQAQSIMRNLLVRSNPDKAAELSAANEAYANLLRVKGASARIGADQGVFTPAQLLSATRELDPSLRKGSFAKGDALMQDLGDAGKSVLGNKVPDSGTPLRGAILAAGSLGPLAAYSPLMASGVAGGGGALSLLYTKPGQKLMASLLASRPDAAPAIANALRKSGPLATTLPAALMANQPSNP